VEVALEDHANDQSEAGADEQVRAVEAGDNVLKSFGKKFRQDVKKLGFNTLRL
jgi:NADH dehydrogenase FAD-containing subunit